MKAIALSSRTRVRMHPPVSTVIAGKSYFFQGAFLLTLEKVLREIQDADGFLLGCNRHGEGVSKAMEAHRKASIALHRFLSPLKVF